MKSQVLLLAAGEGRRFGGLKQLTTIDGKPMVVHCLEACLQANLGDVTVCVGANHDKIIPHIKGSSSIIEIPNWKMGMSESIREGVRSLKSDTTHVLIALADQVAVEAGHFHQLYEKAEAFPDHIIAAKYANTLGVPVIFPRRFFVELVNLVPGTGAKKIINQHTGLVVGVDLPSASIDIDTQHDKEAWKNGQS